MSLKHSLFTKLFNLKPASQETPSTAATAPARSSISVEPSPEKPVHQSVKNAPKDIQHVEHVYDNDFKTEESLTSSSTSSLPSEPDSSNYSSSNQMYLVADRDTYNNINDLSVISEANESNLTMTSNETNKPSSRELGMSSPSFSMASDATLTRRHDQATYAELKSDDSTTREIGHLPQEGFELVEALDPKEIHPPAQSINSQPKLFSQKDNQDNISWTVPSEENKILPKTSSTPSPANSNAKLADEDQPPVIGQGHVLRRSKKRKSNRRKSDMLEYKTEGWIKTKRDLEKTDGEAKSPVLDQNNNVIEPVSPANELSDVAKSNVSQVEIKICAPSRDSPDINEEDEIEQQVQMQMRLQQKQKELEFLRFRSRFDKLESDLLQGQKKISYNPNSDGVDSPNSSKRSSKQSKISQDSDPIYDEVSESEKARSSSASIIPPKLSVDDSSDYCINADAEIELNNEFTYYSTNFLEKDHYNFVGTYGRFARKKGSQASFRSLISEKSTPELSGSESMLSNASAVSSSSSDINDPFDLSSSEPQFFQLSLRVESKQTLDCILRTKNGNLIRKLDVDSVQNLNILRILGRLNENMHIKEIKPVIHPAAPEIIASYDRELSKSTFTFGLIYQKTGQVNEKDILDNVDHSEEFEEFMSFIGQRVQLKNFAGFRGGLDNMNNYTGEYSVYEEFKNNEIMFHVSTLLPHVPKDQQQLERKRHIGNDRVCVVFQDECTPFSPEMIKSKLLHVFMVVQPAKLEDGTKCYQVSVISKNDVPGIEPLIPKPYVFKKNEDLKRFLLTKLINAEYASLEAKAFKKFKVETAGASLSKLFAQLRKLTYEFTGEDFATCGNLESELKRAINQWNTPSSQKQHDDGVPLSPTLLSASSSSLLGNVFLLHSQKQQLSIIHHLQQVYAQQHLNIGPEGDSVLDQNLSVGQPHSSSFSNKIMKKYAFKPFHYLFNSGPAKPGSPQLTSNAGSHSSAASSSVYSSMLNDSTLTATSLQHETSLNNQTGRSTTSPINIKTVSRTQSTNAYDETQLDSNNNSIVSNPDNQTLLSKIKSFKPEFHSKSRHIVTSNSSGHSPAASSEILTSIKTQANNMLPTNMHLPASALPQVPFIHSPSASTSSNPSPNQPNLTPVNRSQQRKTLRDYVKKYIVSSGNSDILPSPFSETTPSKDESSDHENPRLVKNSSGIVKFNSSDNLSKILKDSTPKTQKRQAPLAPVFTAASLKDLPSCDAQTPLKNGFDDQFRHDKVKSAERFPSSTRLGEKQPTRKSKGFNLVTPKSKKDKPESFASRLPFASFKVSRGKSFKETVKPTNSTPSSPFIGVSKLSKTTPPPVKPVITTPHSAQDASRCRCNSLDSNDSGKLGGSKHGKIKSAGASKKGEKTSAGKRFSLMHLI